MTDTNYGILLKRETVLLGEITNLGLPPISTEALEKTNHSSGGVREYIPSGLKEVGEFAFDLNITQASMNTILVDIDNGTISEYTIEYPADLSLSDWVFNAFPITYAAGDADAQAPGVLSANVGFRATGNVTTSG